jgi:peptide/nickel transport system permease protein
MAGCRVSVIVAFYAILFSGSIGALVGMVAGYFGGRVDAVLMRLIEIQQSVPSIALALILAAALEPGLSTVVVVIVLTYWAWYARIIRGEIMALKGRDYIAFARVAGVSTPVIFMRHLLPNIFNTLVVLATLQVGQVILFEASLSFLGLGVQPPMTSLGNMVGYGREYLTRAPWILLAPSCVIVLTTLSVSILGDWLRDRLDPTLV